VKHFDLLSLKAAVIDEIKNEFELTGDARLNRNVIGRPGYVDPFSALEQSYKDQKDGQKLHMVGGKNTDGLDDSAEIIVNSRMA